MRRLAIVLAFALGGCAFLDPDARDPLSRARARAHREAHALGPARGDVTITGEGLFVVTDDDEIVWHARDAIAEARQHRPADEPLRVACARGDRARAALEALQAEAGRTGAVLVVK